VHSTGIINIKKEHIMKWFYGIIVVMILLSGVNAYAQNADSIVGEWYTEGERSIVEIARCGDLYCGKIIWLKVPKDEDGKDKVDVKNPDESMRGRPILGLPLLTDCTYKGANKWEGGKIYDPKNGKTYTCKMTLEGNTLKVRGFVGFSLLGRTTVWTKKM
jgi:uncharacterized protein (DUF2147 family)